VYKKRPMGKKVSVSSARGRRRSRENVVLIKMIVKNWDDHIAILTGNCGKFWTQS
jgi:hypothetical protein